jgi:hypothetical protein
MAKKNYKRRHLKGGFLESIGQTLSSWRNSISQGASNAWNSTKKATGMGSSSSTYPPSSMPSTQTSSYTPTTTPSTYTPTTGPSQYTSGGNKRKTRKFKTVKRGGFHAYRPMNTLADRSSPFVGLTARVNYVGGRNKRKTRRSRH